MKNTYILWVILLLISFSTNAQNSLFQEKEFICRGNTLLYRVILPENYNSSIAYPFAVFPQCPENNSWVTLNLICLDPKTFATAIPICGAVNVESLKKAYKINIRIYNGGSDNVVLSYYFGDASIKLKANGAKNVEHIEFPGVGHDSWTSAFA